MSMDEAAELGSWIAAERGKRRLRGKPLSTPKLAELVNVYIRVQKLPVKLIHQQEISKLENATAEKGPKRSQPWWAVLREFIAGGHLDTLLAAAEGPEPAHGADDAVVVDYWQKRAERAETVVRTPDGDVVGRIVWGKEV